MYKFKPLVITRFSELGGEALKTQDLHDVFIDLFPKASLKLRRLAPSGEALVHRGLLAIVVCLLATMIYITLRFEYRFVFQPL